jgi:hypothetical protein
MAVALNAQLLRRLDLRPVAIDGTQRPRDSSGELTGSSGSTSIAAHR